MKLEEIIQLIAIFSFFSGAVVFFVKTGEYKNGVEKDIKMMKEDIANNEIAIKELSKKHNEMKSETNRVTSNLEALLIEVKTKIDLFMSISGIVNEKHGNNKN